LSHKIIFGFFWELGKKQSFFLFSQKTQTNYFLSKSFYLRAKCLLFMNETNEKSSSDAECLALIKELKRLRELF
jgi:hypothetical protein